MQPSTRFRSLVFGFILVCVTPESRAQDGTLDLGFDPGTGVHYLPVIRLLVPQPDGRVFIAGEFDSLDGTPYPSIARLISDDSLDTSFAPRTSDQPRFQGEIRAVALLPNGKLLIGGDLTIYGTFYSDVRSGLGRINADGSVDTSFNNAFSSGVVNAIGVQADGKILVGGQNLMLQGTTNMVSFLRLTANGMRDQSYPQRVAANGSVQFIQVVTNDTANPNLSRLGGMLPEVGGARTNYLLSLKMDGTVESAYGGAGAVNNTVIGRATQADGKLLLAGSFTQANGTPWNRVLRLNPDYTSDPSFNIGTGADAEVLAVAAISGGKILLAGAFTSFNGTPCGRLIRLNSDGSVDGTFQPGTGANGPIHQIQFQPNGDIIVLGAFGVFNGSARGGIARISGDGSLLPSFAGLAPASAVKISVSAIGRQADGKILIGGDFNAVEGRFLQGVARLNANGTLDPSFHPGTGVDGHVQHIGIDLDGNILLAGMFPAVQGAVRTGLARLLPDGSLDFSFAPAVLKLDGTPGSLSRVIPLSSGQILIGGHFRSLNGASRNYLARLNNDGSLDASFDAQIVIEGRDPLNPSRILTGQNPRVEAFVPQHDQKIVVGGYVTWDGLARGYLMRLNPNGQMDADFIPASVAANAVITAGTVLDTTLTAGGKILAAGGFAEIITPGFSRPRRGGIARFEPSGQLDMSFETGLGANDEVRSLAVQSDDKIVIGGAFKRYNLPDVSKPNNRLRLARLNADGSLDETFQPGSGADDTVNTVVWLPTGRALIGGDFTNYNGTIRRGLAGVIAQVPSTNAFPGLISWWRGEGDASDAQGAHPGSLSGGTAFGAGRVGQAFRFDGVDDSVDLGNWFDLQEFTISLWVNPDSTQMTYADIVDNNHTDFRSWVIQSGNVTDGTQSEWTVGANGVGGTKITLRNGVWQHLAMTVGADHVMQVFVNGSLAGSVTGSGSVGYDGTQFLHIGKHHLLGRYFKGLADEVMVFSRPLPAAEIQALAGVGDRDGCASIPEGLTGSWAGEGNANELQGKLNGTLKDGTSFASGKVGQAFNLSSDGAGVTIPHDALLDVQSPGFTAAFWMKGIKNQPQNLYLVVEKSHGFVDSTGWAFQGDSGSGKISFFVGEGGGGAPVNFAGADSIADVLDGVFHHLAGTWDGSKVRFYVDGVLQGEAALSTPVNNTRPVNVGYSWGGGSPNRFFRGLVDELSIYNRALSEAEILDRFAAGEAGNCGLAEIQVSQGRAALTTGNLSTAHDQFIGVLATNPKHPAANTLAAVTSLGLVPVQPGVSEFLNRVGVSQNGRDPMNWTAQMPTNAAGHRLFPAGVTAGDVAGFAKTNVVPALETADAFLANVTDTNFTMKLGPAESQLFSSLKNMLTFFVPSDERVVRLFFPFATNVVTSGEVVLDYADIVHLRAVDAELRLISRSVGGTDLNVDLSTAPRYYETNGLLNVEKLLADHPNFLRPLSTNDMAERREAFVQWADLQPQALALVTSRGDKKTHLFNYDTPDEWSRLLQFLLPLLKAALDQPVALPFGTNAVVDLAALFDGTFDARSILPTFQGAKVVLGSFPDLTMGGLVKGLPVEWFDDVLEDVTGTPVIGPLGVSLKIRATSNGAVISWPATAQNFVLQRADRLSLTSWQVFATSPEVVGNELTVAVDAGPTQQFYRLLGASLANTVGAGGTISITPGGVFSGTVTNYDPVTFIATVTGVGNLRPKVDWWYEVLSSNIVGVRPDISTDWNADADGKVILFSPPSCGDGCASVIRLHCQLIDDPKISTSYDITIRYSQQ